MKVENLEFEAALGRYEEVSGRESGSLRKSTGRESGRSLSERAPSFERGSGVSARLGRRSLTD
jgi:hypothetical protein